MRVNWWIALHQWTLVGTYAVQPQRYSLGAFWHTSRCTCQPVHGVCVERSHMPNRPHLDSSLHFWQKPQPAMLYALIISERCMCCSCVYLCANQTCSCVLS